MIRESDDHFIFGCGDVGRRIVQCLLEAGIQVNRIKGLVNSSASLDRAIGLGIDAQMNDLDGEMVGLGNCHKTLLYYTVAPRPIGAIDQRSRRVIDEFIANQIKPSRVVLISTTGVYGNCDGEWVSELSPTNPQTDRGKRRLDSETQWLDWGASSMIDVMVLRVPGIYSFSRLPRERLRKGVPVVKAKECGFTNRIHADDLARVCVKAMDNGRAGEIYNATDGTPGKISDYLQAAARALRYEPLPEISMAQARTELSAGMLSYLSESRRISNQKMLDELRVELLYPDFERGLTK